MFEMPKIIANIPDIATIYEINDKQISELEAGVAELENNIYVTTMNEENVKRWESILEIVPHDTDTLDERRFRILSKRIEKLPYSYRVICRKLETLSPDGIKINLDRKAKHMEIKVGLQSARMREEIVTYLEDVLPLDMTYYVDVMWNTYEMLATKTHGELASMTYGEMREKIIGG